MDLRAADGVALRFHAYIEHLSKALGHADRHVPLAEYCTGLLLPGERKSVEPMAARMAPSEVGAKHQSLHHFVAKAPWDETKLLASVRSFVLPIIVDRLPIQTHQKHAHAPNLPPLRCAARLQVRRCSSTT